MLDVDYSHDSENSKLVSFCFCPNSLWLTVYLVVCGWPRAEWEAIQTEDFDTEDCIRFLVETEALQHVDAAVPLDQILFIVAGIHGAL
mmetsp:Transcript_14407/g.26165  ORF Transcript_14407/g.26165 Transcript_14407/m.26165 type:complete len:88 (+) Transcript_14407:539-802(+)